MACDLKLNPDLINPQFEGYRLSLDHLPTFTKQLDIKERKDVLVGIAK